MSCNVVTQRLLQPLRASATHGGLAPAWPRPLWPFREQPVFRYDPPPLHYSVRHLHPKSPVLPAGIKQRPSLGHLGHHSCLVPGLHRSDPAPPSAQLFHHRWRSHSTKTTQPATARTQEPRPVAETKSTKPQRPPPDHSSSYLLSLPHLHAPSKQELLAAATGFWSRFRVHFKWFSIRSARPFNTDDISAFFSWFIFGHILWIFIGTTTFFSLGIFAINTVFAQETLAGWIGNYLTRSSGIKVLFESAIVPKWNDGVISFQNVFVSRRPGQGKSGVQKGSAAAAAAAAAQSDLTRLGLARHDEEEDTNYTQFDLSIDTVNVTLSFAKWFNGRGLLRNVEVKGVRGIVDRTDIHALDHYVDPKSYRHEHQPGDFEIDSFRLDDLLVTVHQPNQFRPFSVSIFSCDLPRLRKQWLFYDFLSANNVSGSFDESLFTIHPRQTHSRTGAQLQQGIEERSETPWKKHSRLRIDGLNIDHLNRGVGGAFSWIREGNVDVVADVMFPLDNDESFVRMMSELYEKVEATVTSTGILGDTQTPDESSTPSPEPVQIEQPQDTHQRFMIMDFRVNLNDVRASVPLLTKDLSYVNNALIRPIVAYINSRHTYIPINCRLVKRMGDFDGSWTLYDSGMMESLSAEMYEAFAQNVLDEQARKRRIKQVGLWSLQLAAQALFVGMAGSIA